tara:strand:+ start:385 stop:669 length:285 start_codon:yes stop_codon:yes gene_type:complete
MAYKQKGFPMHSNASALKREEKWYKNEDGSANTALLEERGFKLDPKSGRYLTKENLTPNQWENRMFISEQRKNNMSTDLADKGKRLLTDEEKYK